MLRPFIFFCGDPSKGEFGIGSSTRMCFKLDVGVLGTGGIFNMIGLVRGRENSGGRFISGKVVNVDTVGGCVMNFGF